MNHKNRQKLRYHKSATFNHQKTQCANGSSLINIPGDVVGLGVIGELVGVFVGIRVGENVGISLGVIVGRSDGIDVGCDDG